MYVYIYIILFLYNTFNIGTRILSYCYGPLIYSVIVPEVFMQIKINIVYYITSIVKNNKNVSFLVLTISKRYF